MTAPAPSPRRCRPSRRTATPRPSRRTTFSDVVEGGDRAALEWTSEGSLVDGRPLTYRGVTVVDFDGDTITRLSTYYDSAQFTATPATTA